MAYITQTSPRKVVPLAGGPYDIQRTRSENGQQNQSSKPVITRRAYFCAVVVEAGPGGRPPSQDVEDLIESLGSLVSPGDGDKIGIERSSSAPNISETASLLDISNGRKRALTSSSAFNDVLNEFVATERSYVGRLRTLKHAYADPLRKFARRKEEAILPAYEAKTLFGNIDAILPANEAFLADLEVMMTPNGAQAVGGIGDVCLKHIRDRRAFDCYKQYYAKREEAQSIFEREMMKKASTGFAGFIDRTKYSTENGNRIGLRELLMEPIQRIPRYTLMFRTMIKHMSPTDPQRAKLLEADGLASKIALAETDEQTKRAMVMHCLDRSIEGFPANLVSNSRKFIDCIDVEDVPVDIIGGGGPSGGNTSIADANVGPLHCTLFLFDDRLLIVKRPNGSASGKSLSGLDDMDRAARNGGLPMGIKKGVMSCKGVMDVTDVVATDVGSSDFHLYLETAPSDQYSDRWANRPFRAYTVVHPPSPVNLDPVRTQTDKARFLENLWNVQAMCRTKDGRSDVRVSVPREMDSGKKSVVRTWFNVYKRTDWLKEPKKHKIILHIDPMGSADPILFGVGGPPFVIARAQPMAGELCRYTVTSSDPNDEGEEDIVHTAAIPARIVQTIHQFGLFKFGTGRNSQPSTPSSARSRASMFGLEAISRNLFNASNSIRGGDVFGISQMGTGHRRTKSGISRSSTLTTTTGTTTTENSLRFSYRSNSTTATSVASVGDGEDHKGTSPRKLVKRGRSPGGHSGPESGSEAELERYGSGSSSQSSSRRGRKSGRLDSELTIDVTQAGRLSSQEGQVVMDESEWDLSMRLELARKNSQTQHVGMVDVKLRGVKVRTESTIEEDVTMEEDLPPSMSTEAQTGSAYLSEYDEDAHRHPTPSLHGSITPTPSLAESNNRPRSIHSVHSDRRPMGPRDPSPTKSPPATRPVTPNLPIRPTTPTAIARPPTPNQIHRPSTPSRPTTPTRRVGAAHSISVNHPLPPVPPLPLAQLSTNPSIAELERVVSPIAARRKAFESRDTAVPSSIPTKPVVSSHPAPRSVQQALPLVPTSVEPLTIKKKTSVSKTSPPAARRRSVASPLERNPSTRRIPAQLMSDRDAAMDDPSDGDTPMWEEAVVLGKSQEGNASQIAGPSRNTYSVQELRILAAATRKDLDSSQRVLKKIRLETELLQANNAKGTTPRAPTRDPMARVQSPSPGIPRSPQSRHIANKFTDARMEEMRQMIQSRGVKTPSSVLAKDLHSCSGADKACITDECSHRIVDLVEEAEGQVKQASESHETLESALSAAPDHPDASSETTRSQGEAASAKRQCEVVKKLLADAISENEILYESFNEELDGMFNDASLPETEAWQAMTDDLRQTKDSRNQLAKNNSKQKRKIEELELQNREYETLLRRHGLIS